MVNYEVTDNVTPTKVKIIRILGGEFAGIEYVYGGISFSEDISTDRLKVLFDYQIINIPEHLGMLDDYRFHSTISDILNDLLEKTVEEGSTVFYGGTNSISL